ncbi:MAG: CAP domain-containing protein [Pseudomonadota bacterium]
MFRILTIGLALLVFGPAAFACAITSDLNREKVVDYVSLGGACLAAPPTGFRFDETVERAFLTKINAERKRQGLAVYRVREALRPAARFQSLDMAANGFFDHKSPDGRRAAQRIAAFDRTLLAQSTGENIAVFGPAKCYDQNDIEVSCFNLPGFKLPSPNAVAEKLHQELMNSEGHRANIMSEDFTHASIGVARTDSGFYVTQLFANPVGRLSEPLPTEFTLNASMGLVPKLSGWDTGYYTVIDAAGERTDLTSDTLSKLNTGDLTLNVVGQNKSEEKRGAETYILTEWLSLSGPSFTLSDATGS